jgi:hypothetical protein
MSETPLRGPRFHDYDGGRVKGAQGPMRDAGERLGELLRGFRSRQTWVRGFFMLIFLFALWFMRLLITIVAVFQFGALLIAGHPLEPLMPFGRGLALYVQQMTLFLTFNTEELPFPFSPWPQGTEPAEPPTQSPERGAATGKDRNRETNTLTEKWRHTFTHDHPPE